MIFNIVHFIEPVFMTTHNIGILGFHELAEKKVDINVDFVLDGSKAMIHVGQDEMVIFNVDKARVSLTHGVDDRIDLAIRGVRVDVNNSLTSHRSPILHPIDLVVGIVRTPLTQGPNERPHFV